MSRLLLLVALAAVLEQLQAFVSAPGRLAAPRRSSCNSSTAQHHALFGKKKRGLTDEEGLEQAVSNQDLKKQVRAILPMLKQDFTTLCCQAAICVVTRIAGAFGVC